MQYVLVTLIVAAAAFFAGRRLLRTLRGKNSCHCQNGNCPHSSHGPCQCHKIHLPDIDTDTTDQPR